MDDSLATHCDMVTTTRFGEIQVWLWKRKADAAASFPCAEVLQVVVTRVLKDDVEAYNRFHNAFVLHRARHKWPHRFVLVYDPRELDTTVDWPNIVEHTAAFALMHSALGEHYKALLHQVVVQLADASLAERILAIQSPFVDETTRGIKFVTTESLVDTITSTVANASR